MIQLWKKKEQRSIVDVFLSNATAFVSQTYNSSTIKPGDVVQEIAPCQITQNFRVGYGVLELEARAMLLYMIAHDWLVVVADCR